MQANIKAKEAVDLVGAINRNAPVLTEGKDDSYVARVAIQTEALPRLSYTQISTILLRFQEFVATLPASAAVTIAVDLTASTEPKNLFLEAVKADYEAKIKAKEETSEANTRAEIQKEPS